MFLKKYFLQLKIKKQLKELIREREAIQYGTNIFDLRIEALAKFGEFVIEPVVEILRSKNGNVQDVGSEILGALNNSLVNKLFSYLNDPDPYVREGIINALSSIKDKQAVPYIIKCLEDPDKHVRWNAAYHLGKFSDNSAKNSLIKVLVNDNEGFNIRHAAAKSLLELGWKPENEMQKVLLAVLNLDGRLIEGSWKTALSDVINYGSAAVDYLIMTLETGHEFVLKYAAKALGEIGDQRARKALLKAANNPDFSYEIKDAAKYALEKLDNKDTRKMTIGVREKRQNKSLYDNNKTDRYGQCSTCKTLIPLSEAREEYHDWDGVDAYTYYCKKCFNLGNYYRGQLLDNFGEKLVDQYS
ncbi:MAG: HEAT repeat domain-containing protein [Ignavibacteriales bacterium]|nr:HEAT repeat domain-containing protein [Ignavibacteriales bacterium]